MISEPLYTIAERLNEVLEKFNEKQVDMVKKTGISSAVLSRYFTGQRIPKQDKIGMIAQVYNIDPAWLMGFDVPMRKKLSSEQAQEDFELLDKWHRLNEAQKNIIKLTIDNFLN